MSVINNMNESKRLTKIIKWSWTESHGHGHMERSANAGGVARRCVAIALLH